MTCDDIGLAILVRFWEDFGMFKELLVNKFMDKSTVKVLTASQIYYEGRITFVGSEYITVTTIDGQAYIPISAINCVFE